MHGWIDVTWCPNPLRPAGDRKIRRVLLTGTDTVDTVIKRLGLHGTSLTASLNGALVAKQRRHKKRVHAGDHLMLTQQAHGIESWVTASAAMSGKTIATAEFLGTLAGLAVDIAASIALSFAANALFGPLAPRNDGSARKDPDGYSIEGGSNQARQYGPLPVVLGEHLVFPDYSTRPFSEFINDPTASIEVVNGTAQTEEQTPPAFGFQDSPPAPTSYLPIAPWSLITGAPPTVPGIYGDNATRTYDSPGGIVNAPHTFIARYSEASPGIFTLEYTTWEDYSSATELVAPYWRTAGPFAVITRYGYTQLFNAERLASIFNFGFGDLEVTDLRIGASPLENYTNWHRHDSAVLVGQLDRTALQGYTSPGWIGDDYPTHVQTADGASLTQHAGVANDGWVVREGLPGCYHMQIDLYGRLFYQGNGGPENLSCVFEAQYREVGAASWTDFPFSPITLVNGMTTPVRETFRFHAPAPARYELRIRRVTHDATDARAVSDVTLTQVKFFIDDNSQYPAQKRVALLVQATGQLNGRLERLSALVKAKHWRWNSALPWVPGIFPGEDARWVWGPTTNPAWLFLYYARGGFQNDSATPAYFGGGKGWLDRPDPSNGPRLFGAGLENDRIDYAAIVAWAQYCDAAGLQCHMVLDAQRPCAEVLDDIATAGRASKTWAPGKLSVVWEAPDQPSIAVFGMPNIVAGTFQISYDDDDSTDEFVLDFTDSDKDFSADTVRAPVPGIAQPVNTSNIKAAFAMSRAQAQQQVNLLAASKFYHRRHIQWESTREALMIQRGDIVALAHDLTQWASSGRLVDVVADEAGNVVTIEVSCLVDGAAADDLFVWLRRPDGSFRTLQCVPPTSPARILTVITDWPLSDAPGVFASGEDNQVSAWLDTVPEDWIFLAGPMPTPGKRVRITAIEPGSNGRFRISARDEVAEYYPMATGGSAVAVASGERLVARAFNLGMEPSAAGGRRLVWDLENAHGAEVMVSVNGGAAAQIPVQGYLTVSGTELLLPEYAPGTHLDIQVLPVTAGAPVAVEGDRIAVTV